MGGGGGALPRVALPSSVRFGSIRLFQACSVCSVLFIDSGYLVGGSREGSFYCVSTRDNH